jgi:hypothetical protein
MEFVRERRFRLEGVASGSVDGRRKGDGVSIGVNWNLRVAERVDEFLARSGIGEERFFQALSSATIPNSPTSWSSSSRRGGLTPIDVNTGYPDGKRWAGCVAAIRETVRIATCRYVDRTRRCAVLSITGGHQI